MRGEKERGEMTGDGGKAAERALRLESWYAEPFLGKEGERKRGNVPRRRGRETHFDPLLYHFPIL